MIYHNVSPSKNLTMSHTCSPCHHPVSVFFLMTIIVPFRKRNGYQSITRNFCYVAHLNQAQLFLTSRLIRGDHLGKLQLLSIFGLVVGSRNHLMFL